MASSFRICYQSLTQARKKHKKVTIHNGIMTFIIPAGESLPGNFKNCGAGAVRFCGWAWRGCRLRWCRAVRLW